MSYAIDVQKKSHLHTIFSNEYFIDKINAGISRISTLTFLL